MWIAVVVIAVSADWYLGECTVHGQRASGTDCFGAAAVVPQTDSEPASWLGFIPLAIVWCMISGCAFVALRRWRRAPDPHGE
jgi:hypothetical protein